MPIDLIYYLILSSLLFCIGMLGVLLRRNSIVMLMCVELMLSAANLLLVVFSKIHAGGEEAQLFVFFVMIVAAAEVTIGLALIVLVYRLKAKVNIDTFHQLKH